MAVDDSYTKSLLHFDGTNGTQVFTDESGKTWSSGGNYAEIRTAAAKFGTAGLYLDRSSYVYTSYVADFQVGAGDFTFDIWYNSLETPASGPFILWIGNDGNYYSCIYMAQNTNNTITAAMYNAAATATTLVSVATITPGVYSHLMMSRANSKLYLGVGGTVINTNDNSGDIGIANSNPVMGIGTNYGATYHKLHPYAYLDEARFSKGIARWTADYTPPTSAYSPATTSFISRAFIF